MKVSIEGTPKEIKELLQVIVSNQEQKIEINCHGSNRKMGDPSVRKCSC